MRDWIFPSTRYQGSKRKLLPWIYENIKDIKFESALDLFGGSGNVGYLFKKMGKSTTYNDCLKFNYLIGKAIIEMPAMITTCETKVTNGRFSIMSTRPSFRHSETESR